MLDSYVSALAAAPLAEQTRRTYASKVRQYLAWLTAAELDGDPLGAADGRDWAVRDYRTHLQTVLKRRPTTINNALAAVDDLYIRRGLGPALRSGSRSQTGRLERWTRRRRSATSGPCRGAVPRDKALALVPFYAGARIGETVALDVDVRLSARKGILRIYGKGERVREVPIHPELRKALTDWLEERCDWPRANDSPALFLNQRGQRLSAKGAHDVITGIADRGGLEDHVTAHVLRHSFATTLVRGGTDLGIAAELLGHARLETTRVYTSPTAEDRSKAVDLLPVDE